MTLTPEQARRLLDLIMEGAADQGIESDAHSRLDDGVKPALRAAPPSRPDERVASDDSAQTGQERAAAAGDA